MMDPTLKRKWVRALRSGKYRQGRGTLMDKHDAYCCLGVLCAIQEKPDSDEFGYFWRGYHDLPPLPLAGGLDDDTVCLLMEANDKHRWTFAEIADYVEIML